MLNTLLLGVALTLAAPAPKDAPKTPQNIEGTWEITKADGPKSDAPPGSFRFTFAEGRVRVSETRAKAPERNEDATYTVDLTKKPAAIDIKPEKGPKDAIVKGIFEVEGNTLKFCFGRDNTDRPTEFKGDATKNIQLMILKRVEEKK